MHSMHPFQKWQPLHPTVKGATHCQTEQPSDKLENTMHCKHLFQQRQSCTCSMHAWPEAVGHDTLHLLVMDGGLESLPQQGKNMTD